MSAGPIQERNQGTLSAILMDFSPISVSYVFPTVVFLADATVYVGGLDSQVTENMLWELFVQAGPVGKWVNIIMKPRIY